MDQRDKSQANQSSSDLKVEEIADKSIFHVSSEEDQSIQKMDKPIIEKSKEKKEIFEKSKKNGSSSNNGYQRLLPENFDDIDDQGDSEDEIQDKDQNKKESNNKSKNGLKNQKKQRLNHSELSVQNVSFQKNQRVSLIAPTSKIRIRQYTFSLTIENVIVQLIQGEGEKMSDLFDCIALPYSDIPFNMSPCQSMIIRKSVGGNKTVSAQSTIADETKKGRIGVAATYFLNETWFSGHNRSHWKAGIMIRVPKAGIHDDRLLLFRCPKSILNQFQINAQSNKNMQSLVIPWLADQTFNVGQAAEMLVQGIFKGIKQFKNKSLKRLSICVNNPEQLVQLKSNLRKKLMILMTKQ